MNDVLRSPLTLFLLLAASFTHGVQAANFPSGSYVYSGGLKDYRNLLVSASDLATLQVVRLNGDVLASSPVTDATGAGVNFRLEVPTSLKPTPSTAVAGEPVRALLLRKDAAPAMADLPPVGAGFGGTNLFLQVVKMTSYTNVLSGAVVEVPDEYVLRLGVFMEAFGYSRYDPFADWDADGISNYDEYLGGTNPFDKSERLRIHSFSATGEGNMYALTFEYSGGRVYGVGTSPALSRPAWTRRKFRPEPKASAEQDFVSYPQGGDDEPGLGTIYLTPMTSSNEFFRVELH